MRVFSTAELNQWIPGGGRYRSPHLMGYRSSSYKQAQSRQIVAACHMRFSMFTPG